MSAKELWADVAMKYPVHEETIAATQKALDSGLLKPWNQMTREEAVAQTDALCISENLAPFNGTVKEQAVPSPQIKNGIPITIYKPSQCPEVPIVFVYFHGGGLIRGSRKTHANTARLLASSSQAIVLNVEYRLLPCPEDPLAPFKDAVTVVEWVLKNKEAVGGSAKSKVGVGGDSAGGQLTCSVTNDIPGLDFQVLIYPVTDLFCNLPSHDEFRDIPGFNTEGMETLFKWTELPLQAMADNPRVNPSARKNLESSPPTLVMVAQLDPLRDWGVAYAKKLKAAGVRVEEVMVEGVPHGFFSRMENYPSTSAKAHECAGNFIKSFY